MEDDLVSDGFFGLLDAIDRFEPGRGFRFETYAVSRIRGAIIDELRRIDWVPRRVRMAQRSIDRTRQALAHELLREPSNREVADRLGISDAELAKALGDVSATRTVSLDTEPVARAPGERRGRWEVDGIAGSIDPFEHVGDDDLTWALSGLASRTRLVLTLYYFENMRMRDIAEILGVTESRVCQIHATGLTELRRRYARPERGEVVAGAIS